MKKCIPVEQYVFRELTGFDPELESGHRIDGPKVDLYARNAKALMDETDRILEAAPTVLRAQWVTAWAGDDDSTKFTPINRRALAVAITAASLAPYPSNPSGVRALRRIYATLGEQLPSRGRVDER